MKNYYSTDRPLKNFNVLQAETGKNSTTSLFSDTTKQELFEQDNMLLKFLQVLIMLNFQILLTLNYNLKVLNLKLKINWK